MFALPLAAHADDAALLDCSTLREPAYYCAHFSGTPTLKSDPLVGQARASCEQFYQSVLDSLQLLCTYDKDAKDFEAKVHASSSQVNGSANALGVSTGTYEEAQAFWRKYRQLVQEQAVRLQSAFKRSESKLVELSRKGVTNLRAEVSCKSDGVTGAAPGFLLAGLAVQSARDQVGVFEKVRDALQFLYEDATETGTKAHQLGSTASVREKAHDSIPPATGSAKPESLTDTTKLNSSSGERILIGDSRNVFNTLPRFWRRSGFLAIHLLLNYMKYGEVDYASLFTAGVKVASYSLGLSAGWHVALSVGLIAAEVEIRKALNAREQRQWKPFVDFCVPRVKEAAGLTSDQLAKEYRPTKNLACPH